MVQRKENSRNVQEIVNVLMLIRLFGKHSIDYLPVQRSFKTNSVLFSSAINETRILGF